MSKLLNLGAKKWFSSVTFFWIRLFGWREWINRSHITFKTLPSLPLAFDTDCIYAKFSYYWDIEQSRSVSSRKTRLWLPLFQAFKFTFLFLFCVSVFYLAFLSLSYVLLLMLIRALEEAESYSALELVGIASLLGFCAASMSFFTHTMEYGSSIIGMKYRNILTTAIYQKMQAMSLSTLQTFSFGKILTIITSDLFKFDEYFHDIFFIIISPIGILVMISIAYIEIGWTATLIVPLFVLHLILQFSLGYEISVLYRNALNWADKRNKLLSEFFGGIRLIKCCAWEYAVAATIRKIKKQELFMILSNLLLKSSTISFAIFLPLLIITMVCLSVYAYIGGQFTSSRVIGFAGLMFLYYALFIQLNHGVIGISEIRICINRTQTVLLAQNRVAKTPYLAEEQELSSRIQVSAITAGKMSSDESTELFFNNISFNVENGEKLSVIGRVGSGKSSLLLSLLNELDTISGEFRMNGSCGYVPQEPWIVSTSLRDNITYGRPWNRKWYDEVVSACCLELDFANLPEGDETVVGDRGITLSGGQKARVSLARAVYANMDVYLLDDPLSSVDASVAKQLLHIFTEGILSDKTTILATHQLQFISATDKILLLDDGNQITYGSYSDVKNHPDFQQFSVLKQYKPSVPSNLYNMIDLIHKESVITTNETAQDSAFSNDDRIQEEVVTHFDSISFLVYLKYFWTGGNISGIFFLLSFSLLGLFGLIIGKYYYLVWWIEANAPKSSNRTYFNGTFLNMTLINPLVSLSFDARIYFFLLLCTVVSVLFTAATVTYTWIPAIASHKLHNRMLWRVLRAQTSFFYKNAIGAVMNRFSKDISTMEHHLPILWLYYLYQCFFISFTFVAALISHWLTLVPCILLVFVLVLYRFQLVRTIRQLKRLESTAKSDVISHFSSTYHGITTIHSLNLESHQLLKMRTYQNTHLNCWRVFYAYLRFFSFQLDVLIALYGFIVAIILILLRNELSPIVSGFVLSQVFFLLDQSQYGIRMSSEVEMNMVAVERVFDYIALPEEAPLYSNRKSAFQIKRGDIEFRNVQLKYSSELPIVLKDVSFQVRGGAKLGIVGRTGSGKTSLQNALLRLIELTSGCITIDGIDIKELGLHELRNQISIIPQDPVMFSGTIRFTLDPFSLFTDDQLWRVLEEVGLGRKVRGLEGGLRFSVSEGGSNFSVGERQLICLARAILKQSKILMLDEATSYIDTLTDNKIQRLLQSKFDKCTLLTIAHRVQTVMECDHIMVMNNGRIVEFDSPLNLLANRSSKFHQMVNLS